jgi:hypothetical protein
MRRPIPVNETKPIGTHFDETQRKRRGREGEENGWVLMSRMGFVEMEERDGVEE